MSNFDMGILEKVVYSRGSLDSSQGSLSSSILMKSFMNGESLLPPRDRIRKACPLSEAAMEEVKRAAASSSDRSLPRPIPIQDIENKKLTSSDFFRLYNNIACRTAKSEALHQSFLSDGPGEELPKSKPIIQKIMKQVTHRRAVSPQKFILKKANKKYTVIMHTVKRPDPSSRPFPSLEEMQ
ncbi:Uncharacterized protein FKW44_016081, partial [Caligus rogercresseyi]